MAQVKSTNIRGKIQPNQTVDALHTDSGTYRKAMILRITDGSQYTVRFPDGDERTVRRNGVTLMGPTHFNDGDTLADFPLTDPGTFGAPAAPPPSAARKRRRTSEVDASESGGAAVDGENSSGGSDSSAEGSSAAKRSSVTHAAASTSRKAATEKDDDDDDGDDDDDDDDDGELEEAPCPTGTHHEVVLVNPSRDAEDTGEPWWPALVVPASEVMREMIGASNVDHKFQFVVRFFEDNLCVPYRFPCTAFVPFFIFAPSMSP